VHDACVRADKRRAHLGRGDAVDEADLLEAAVRDGQSDFPPGAGLLVDHLQRLVVVVHLVLRVLLQVLFEASYLRTQIKFHL